MDIFAHMAWTNIVFYKKLKQEKLKRFIAVLFGVVPDFVSFAPVFIYQFISQTNFMELVGENIWVVRYAEKSYQYTHSIIIFALAFVLVALIRKYWFKFGSFVYWPMFGWLLHILIDIPTHTDFFATPLLFPFSNYHFINGISWAHPTFMLINYSVLATAYLIWFFVFRKKS